MGAQSIFPRLAAGARLAIGTLALRRSTRTGLWSGLILPAICVLGTVLPGPDRLGAKLGAAPRGLSTALSGPRPAIEGSPT